MQIFDFQLFPIEAAEIKQEDSSLFTADKPRYNSIFHPWYSCNDAALIKTRKKKKEDLLEEQGQIQNFLSDFGVKT